ncbi:aromatase/cyclase [Streptomyces phytophilus]|uniref:aromatase/cyclase n=1 Tax=Streptomyces phytophilus TaxID=722715 RepID=UPI0015F0780B|nr:aromatase/cyclase [Streptomyces phytophilus]
MSEPGRHRVEHEILVSAPAADVYRLLAEVENWPRIFPPTIHVDHLERSERTERIRIWATAVGRPKNWTSRRTLDAKALRIDFRQEVSTPPVASMGGTWIIEPHTTGGCTIRLLHDYTAIDDDPAGLAWIDEAVDTNSRSELAALKTNVERTVGAAELTFSFEDTVYVDGDAKDVYDFVNEAHLWHERLPHVAAVRLEEHEPGLQTLQMDTRAPNGTIHTTRSHRVCFPDERIHYKQTTLPALMDLHTGRWTFRPTGSGVTAASQHTVVIKTENITAVLGQDAGVADARRHVKNALSANSRATLDLAKAYAEGRR